MKVLAHIPEDIDKVIRTGGNAKIIVSPEICEYCGENAELVVQGETDSFGFEVIFCCKRCNEQMSESHESYLNAGDVDDRYPEPGNLFVVNETTNLGSEKVWRRAFISFREAVGYYRRAEDQAAGMAGLYPDNGVEELPHKDLAWVPASLRKQSDALGQGDPLDSDDTTAVNDELRARAKRWLDNANDPVLVKLEQLLRETVAADDPAAFLKECYEEERYPRGWVADLYPAVQDTFN